MSVKRFFSIFIGFAILFVVYHLSEIDHLPVAGVFLAFVLFFVVTHFVVRFLGGKKIWELGLQRHPGSGKNLLLGYICGFFFYMSAMVYAYLRGQVKWQGTFSLGNTLVLLCGMVLLTLLSSASEDLLTRGFVFRFFSDRLSPLQLILITSVLYVLNHIWRIGGGVTQWLLLFLMGLTFVIPYVKTKSLWFSIGCHWGWNTVSLYKGHIGEMSSFQVVDHTNDWLYVVVMCVFCLFVIWCSRFLTVATNSASTRV